MIHIICALHCEAKPLIEQYRLKRRDAGDVFPIFTDRQQYLTLTVSGTGKVNAAAATMYTHGLSDSKKSDVWLNVGISAHERLPIGQAALARCICDVSNGKNWYPQFVFEPPCQLATLLTLDRPSTSYVDKLFDLEAAGFYETACRIATTELIHVIKIISDNRENPAVWIAESTVEELVREQLEVIDSLISSLQSLSSELESIDSPPQYYSECLDKWRLTQYQKNSLYRLLQRWQILCPHINPVDTFREMNDSKKLLKSLKQHLDEQAIDFSGT